MNKPTVCKCGQGYASRFDGKCGHCRSRREHQAHRTWVANYPNQFGFRDETRN